MLFYDATMRMHAKSVTVAIAVNAEIWTDARDGNAMRTEWATHDVDNWQSKSEARWISLLAARVFACTSVCVLPVVTWPTTRGDWIAVLVVTADFISPCIQLPLYVPRSSSRIRLGDSDKLGRRMSLAAVR